jgi:hypothetical protein
VNHRSRFTLDPDVNRAGVVVIAAMIMFAVGIVLAATGHVLSGAMTMLFALAGGLFVAAGEWGEATPADPFEALLRDDGRGRPSWL